MKENQKGFSLAEVLILFAVISLIAGIGMFVYSRQQDKSETDVTNTSSSVSTNEGDAKQDTDKTYTNNEYGFSFSHPANLMIEEKFEDLGRGGKEGSVTILNGSDKVIVFSPNQGGKGGDCINEETEQRSAKTCYTVTYSKIEKLTNDSKKPIYLFRVNYLPPQNSGDSKRVYTLSIIDDTSGEPKTETFLTPLILSEISTEAGYVGVEVFSKENDLQGEAYYSDTNVLLAEKILRTFKTF